MALDGVDTVNPINTTTPCPFALARQNSALTRSSYPGAEGAPVSTRNPVNSAAIPNPFSADIAPAEADEATEAYLLGPPTRTPAVTDPNQLSAIHDGNIISANNSLSPHRGLSSGSTGTGRLGRDGRAGIQAQQEPQENRFVSYSSQQQQTRSRQHSRSAADDPDHPHTTKRRRVEPEEDQEDEKDPAISASNLEQQEDATGNNSNSENKAMRADGMGSPTSPESSENAAHISDPAHNPISATNATSPPVGKHNNSTSNSSTQLNDAADQADIQSSDTNGYLDPDILSSIKSSSHLQSQPYRGHNREEVARILIQGLQDLGYHSSASVLSRESGYRLESPIISRFRRSILRGNWEEAEAIMTNARQPGASRQVSFTGTDGNAANGNSANYKPDGSTHRHRRHRHKKARDIVNESQIDGEFDHSQVLILLDNADRGVMIFAIKQQKYLELVDKRDIPAALTVLQRELTPMHHDVLRLHALSR